MAKLKRRLRQFPRKVTNLRLKLCSIDKDILQRRAVHRQIAGCNRGKNKQSDKYSTKNIEIRKRDCDAHCAKLAINLNNSMGELDEIKCTLEIPMCIKRIVKLFATPSRMIPRANSSLTSDRRSFRIQI